MPKYALTFAFAGAGAAHLAKRKAIALGGDAKALSAEDAKKAGVAVPKKADNADAPPAFVVVAGETAEAGR